MSSQHQAAGNPAKSDRRVEHHRERQATRTALHVSDLEDVLDPPSVHNVSTSVSDAQVETKGRRFVIGSSRSGSGAHSDATTETQP